MKAYKLVFSGTFETLRTSTSRGMFFTKETDFRDFHRHTKMIIVQDVCLENAMRMGEMQIGSIFRKWLMTEYGYYRIENLKINLIDIALVEEVQTTTASPEMCEGSI